MIPQKTYDPKTEARINARAEMLKRLTSCKTCWGTGIIVRTRPRFKEPLASLPCPDCGPKRRKAR